MLTVRPASEKDIPAILKLLVQVNLVHHEGRPDLFKGPATKYSAAELSRILTEPENPVFVCVNEEDLVLGHAFCQEKVIPDSNLLVGHKMLYIDDICVHESHRKEGIGRLLFLHIKDYAKARGFYHLTLNVWAVNPGAATFYEALGMEAQKTTMELIL